MAAKRLDPPPFPNGQKPFTWRLDKEELDLLCWPAEQITDIGGIEEHFHNPKLMVVAFGVVLISLVGERAYSTYLMMRMRAQMPAPMSAAQFQAMMAAQQAAAAAPTASEVQQRQAEAPIGPEGPIEDPRTELIHDFGLGVS